MADQKIELANVLQYVSLQLQNASATAKENGLAVMQFEECKLEFAVSAEKEAGGGLKLWIVNLGGEAKKSEAHTITVTMKAIPGTIVVAPMQTSETEEPFVRQTPKPS